MKTFEELKNKVSSWDDLVREMGEEQTRLPFQNAVSDRQFAANAHWRIMCAVEYFKQGEKCDYAPNNDQCKYFAWMRWQPKIAGLGFSGTDATCDDATTDVGPRLCSLSDSAAHYIATVVCVEDYKKYFNEK